MIVVTAPSASIPATVHHAVDGTCSSILSSPSLAVLIVSGALLAVVIFHWVLVPVQMWLVNFVVARMPEASE